MCGLIGFFNGCDLQVACPKAKAGQCNHKKSGIANAFKSWDRTASVRREPSRVGEIENFSFPKEFVPILRASKIADSPRFVQECLRESALFRFLNFTHKLELLVVNTVTANIALGIYDFDVQENVRLDAHRLYVDEGYHAYFSFHAMQVMQQSGSEMQLLESTPAFINVLNAKTAEETDERRKALLQLFFVIASEMLITATLHEAQNQQGLDPALGQMPKDHARDESRHHVFYKSFLLRIWDQMNVQDQIYVAGILPDLVAAYCIPDRSSVISDLLFLGFSDADARETFEETYPANSTAEYVRKVGSGLFRTVRELGSPGIRDCLDTSLLHLST